MPDIISQILDGLAAMQKPSQIAFVNGMPVINPEYKGPAVQRAQLVQPPALQARIDGILDSLNYQDQWLARMRLPLERKAEKLLEGTVWPK